jgi:hypothetical protein
MGARGQSKLKHTVAVINYTTNKRNRLTPTQIIVQELIHFANNWITQNSPYLYLVNSHSVVFSQLKGFVRFHPAGVVSFFFTRRRDDDCSLEAANFRPRSWSPETRETELWQCVRPRWRRYRKRGSRIWPKRRILYLNLASFFHSNAKIDYVFDGAQST